MNMFQVLIIIIIKFRIQNNEQPKQHSLVIIFPKFLQQKILIKRKMAIQKYDPFSIKRYAFALRKSNTYFSFTTILISLAIIALSIVMNLDVISHLWIPLQQLPMTQSRTDENPGILTSTLMCFPIKGQIYNLTNVPPSKAYDVQKRPLNIIKEVPQKEALKKYPNLATRYKGNDFHCIDIAGLELSNNNPINYIQIPRTRLIQTTNYGNFDDKSPQAIMYYQTTSIQDIIYSKPIQFYSNSNHDDSDVKCWAMPLQFISAKIYNSLYLNSDPQIITTFIRRGLTYQKFPRPTITNSSNIVFSVTLLNGPFQLVTNELKKPYNMLHSITIIRYDIGYILGTIIGWISTVAFACSLIIGPIMDKALIFAQVRCLYVLEEPARDPSFFRFLVASYRKGVYPKEDIIVKMSQEMQERKNIAMPVKLEKALRHLCIFTNNVYDVICSDDNFNDPDYDPNYPLPPYNDGKETRRTAAQFAWKSEQKQQKDSVRRRKAFLKWLDIGSDTITLFFDRHGHGSKASICISVIFGVGFLVFLNIFGVLKYGTTQQKYDTLVYESSYTIQPMDLALMTKMPPYPLKPIFVQVFDGNNKMLSNDTTIIGTSCLKYLTKYQKASFTNQVPYLPAGFYQYTCLPNNITLVNSKDPLKTRYMRLTTAGKTFFYQQGALSPKSNPNMFYSLIYPINPLDVKGKGYLKLVNNIKDGSLKDQKSYFQAYRLTSPLNYLEPGLAAVDFFLNQYQANIQTSTVNIFDLVQTVWGLALICFTVVLMKITKYINIYHKRSRMTPELAEFRESVCIMLTKVNKLLIGKNKTQLQRARLYMKEQIFGNRKNTIL